MKYSAAHGIRRSSSFLEETSHSPAWRWTATTGLCGVHHIQHREAYGERYNGSAWSSLGLPAFLWLQLPIPPGNRQQRHAVRSLSRALNTYISGRATVMKFDGSAWVAVGTAGFSPSTVNAISLRWTQRYPLRFL